MEPEIKNFIIQEAQSIFAEDAGAHRQYLEKQFSQLRWAVSVLLAIILAAAYFFIGRSMSELQTYAKSRVNETVTTYVIKEAVREELLMQIDQEVREKIDSKGIQDTITEELKNTISVLVNQKVNEEIKTTVDREIERVFLPPF